MKIESATAPLSLRRVHRPPEAARLFRTRANKFACSVADQALSVGGGLLVNVALARTQSRAEYGMFALSYSILIFLLSLHNASILEPFTVYGSGRYRHRLADYSCLMGRTNLMLGLLLTALILGGCTLLGWLMPIRLPRALLGMGLALGFLFWGALLRRNFYLERRPLRAAAASLIFFLTVACGLWLMVKTHRLDSFSSFLLLSAGWLVAGLNRAGRSAGAGCARFSAAEPGYWREHWRYSRWVLLTALVFQLTTQGYYWLVAFWLSVGAVGELKAMALIIAPAEQVFIALNYLVLPVLAAQHAAKKTSELLSAWRLYAVTIAAMTLSFAALIHAAGRRFTHTIYGGRYDDAASLLNLLALVPVVMGIGHTMNAALKAVESPQLVFWAYTGSGTVTMLFGVPLVARFGLRGAVYGMLCSGASYTALLAAGLAVTFRRELRSAVAA